MSKRKERSKLDDVLADAAKNGYPGGVESLIEKLRASQAAKPECVEDSRASKAWGDVAPTPSQNGSHASSDNWPTAQQDEPGEQDDDSEDNDGPKIEHIKEMPKGQPWSTSEDGRNPLDYTPKSEIERDTDCVMLQATVTRQQLENWIEPDFQRRTYKNKNTEALTAMFNARLDAGLKVKIPSTISFGRLKSGSERYNGRLYSDQELYTTDGLQRRGSALASRANEFSVCIRVEFFEQMNKMSEAFWHLNTNLVTMRPDDKLKAMSIEIPVVKALMTCRPGLIAFLGGKGGSKGRVMSCAKVLSNWYLSGRETPTNSAPAVTDIATEFPHDEIGPLTRFVMMADDAWEYNYQNNSRLRGQACMVICMWMYRHLVLNPVNPQKRHVRLEEKDFFKMLECLNVPKFATWVGTSMDKDRHKAFSLIKEHFRVHLNEENAKRVKEGLKKLTTNLPDPAWGKAPPRGQ